ncbi:MAG TPA: PaaI family thioesterase [Tepidiformaceae bacterium]
MDETPPVDPRESVRRWIPDELPPHGQWQATVRLAAALRRTIDLMMDRDAPEDVMRAAAEATERFAERLASFPKGRSLFGYAETSTAGNPKAMFDSSPLIGLANPIAPPITISVTEKGIEGRVTYGAAYEGPVGHAHGGVVASGFDEVLGMVQSLGGNPGMTGTLNVRYRSPTPLHREVVFRGWIERVDGRKTFTAGTLHAGDTLCAEAEGLFIAVDWERFHRLAQEQ